MTASGAREDVNRLFHFTCDHGYNAIASRGELRPIAEHPFLHVKVVWLTTEGQPDRQATGLGMTYTRCDRMKYRYVVTDLRTCHPWLGSPERGGAPPGAVEDLERFGDPEHWWITDEPTKARLG